MEADFEKSFSAFPERYEYDEAEQALFRIVRAAYAAGWNAAGGRPPKPQDVLRLLEETKQDT